MTMRLQSRTYRRPNTRGVTLGAGAPDGRVGPRAPRTRDEHKRNLLTLLSGAETATGTDLAYVVELSKPYVSIMLDELELEGRVESTRVGRERRYRLA